MESIAKALFNLVLELLFVVGLTRNLSLEKNSYSLLFFSPTGPVVLKMILLRMKI